MNLAIFDLDHTLLAGDSDHAWGAFMTEHGLVDAEFFRRRNDEFLVQYQQGTLDIDEFLQFTLAPLAEHSTEKLYALRAQFIEQRIRPMITDQARDLVEKHRAQGHLLIMITATNAFVTEPIAEELGFSHLLATRPEMRDGRYTGRYVGTPTFREGKVIALEQWLADEQIQPAERWFYSDSHNDLPLLEQVDHPVAVNPDEQLKAHAQQKGWPIITLY